MGNPIEEIKRLVSKAESANTDLKEDRMLDGINFCIDPEDYSEHGTQCLLVAHCEREEADNMRAMQGLLVPTEKDALDAELPGYFLQSDDYVKIQVSFENVLKHGGQIEVC